MTRTELKKYLHPFQRFPTRTMEGVYLHFCNGLSQSEAARRVGVSRNAINRAAKKIRERMNQ